LQTHAKVVVVGGGVVGCSVLFHLAKLGWQDLVLLERKRLTAGSTWHAAAGYHAMNGDANVARLQAYTVKLYREIEAMSGQNVGLHPVGGINIAATAERWDMLKNEAARHRVMGIETHLVTPSEIEALCPIFDGSEIKGGLFDSNEGYLDPYGVTIAYAQCAKQLGARVHEGVKVEALTARGDGGWDVATDQGTIHAEHVVNAAGLWAREVGAMAGVQLPLIPMQHHYLISGPLPELESRDREIPFMIDLDGGIYLRQEHKGVLLGVYEQASRVWAEEGTPWDYGESDLLPPRLEDLEPELITGFRRFQAVERAGIKRIVNGPFTFTSDGNPLVGPVPGLRNYWAACGVMAGFAQGGGVGLALSQWMSRGVPDGDVFAMDVARFGGWCTRRYVREKAEEFYRRRFQIAFPNEAWPAGRPLKTSPLYSQTSAAGAVYAAGYGLEQAAWFAGSESDAQETYTFRRSNAHVAVGQECLAARTAVAVWDAAAFAKYEVTGPAAESWLDRLLASRLPRPGRVALAPMLRHDGRLMGDLTVGRLAPDRFWVMGSYYLQAWYSRWFSSSLPASGVELRNISDAMPGLALIGPHSRLLLERLSGRDCSNTAFPFMRIRPLETALAPAHVARLSVAGELGYEIHAEAAYLPAIFAAVMRCGADLGVRPVGFRAVLSLRLEKGFGIWSREYSPDCTPRMSGLDRFVDYAKPDFIGRDAAIAERESPPTRRLVAFSIDAGDSDASGHEPIWRGDTLVGFVTSGGYGHTVGQSLALAYVDSEYIDYSAGGFEVELLGERRRATLLERPAYDPAGLRMRA
jgi:dimethylglycine dehydrogenase